MKHCIFLLLMLIGIAVSGQPMLGQNREYVLQTVRADEGYTRLTEGTSSDGSRFIVVYNSENEMLKWSLVDGVVEQYLMMVRPNRLNIYVNYLDKHYINDETFQWSDYSTGRRIYWHVTISGSFFAIVASWYDLEL